MRARRAVKIPKPRRPRRPPDTREADWKLKEMVEEKRADPAAYERKYKPAVRQTVEIYERGKG